MHIIILQLTRTLKGTSKKLRVRRTGSSYQESIVVKFGNKRAVGWFLGDSKGCIIHLGFQNLRKKNVFI